MAPFGYELIWRFRYFKLEAGKPEPDRLQRGTVRTNCMDNLDRTNVAQAALAKWTLEQQLVELGILPPGAGIDNYEEFSKDFRASMKLSSTSFLDD